jgi:hypothetical protein
MSSTSSSFQQAGGSSTLPTAQLLLLQRNNDGEKDGITLPSESRDLYCYPLRSGQDSCRRAVRIVVAAHGAYPTESLWKLALRHHRRLEAA